MTARGGRAWRKRWAAALLLWLAVAYPLSVGPLQYAEHRVGLPAFAWLPYVPLVAAFELAPETRDATLLPYLQWWHGLAMRHEAATARRAAGR